MDDKTFLEYSEMGFFFQNLFTQVAQLRPDDSVEFAFQYFQKVRSCQNVLGADYGFISGCNKNRRAFVFCLMELFKTFGDDEEMNVNECQQIIEMVCPNFPNTIMPAVVSSLEVKNANASPPKYRHGDIRVSLYFNVIYDEWLKYIMTVFKEEGSLDCLSVFRVKAYIEDCRKNKRVNFSQPSEECVESALGKITSQEVSFVMLKKALFDSKITEMDVTRVSKHTSSLLSEVSALNATAAVSSSTSIAAAKPEFSEAPPFPPPSSAPTQGSSGRSGSRISATSLMSDGASTSARGKESGTSKKKTKASVNSVNSSDDDDSDDDGASRTSSV